jgi:hypothetical protein
MFDAAPNKRLEVLAVRRVAEALRLDGRVALDPRSILATIALKFDLTNSQTQRGSRAME